MERIVTGDKGSDDSHGHIPSTEENACPSQHSKHIQYIITENPRWFCVNGVHHVSFVKATEGHCVGKVNPSELLSQHGLNIYGELYQIKVCADWFQATKWGFHWQQGEKCVCWFLAQLCSSINTENDLEWKKHELLLSGLSVVWNTHSTKSPCMRFSPFPLHQWPKTNLIYLEPVHRGFKKSMVQKCKQL